MTACGGVISHQMKGPPAKTVVDSVAASCHSHIRGSSVSVKGKHPYAAFLRVSVGCLRVIFFPIQTAGAGTVVVGSSLPQISSDELAPASSALNPCKPIIIQTETVEAACG